MLQPTDSTANPANKTAPMAALTLVLALMDVPFPIRTYTAGN